MIWKKKLWMCMCLLAVVWCAVAAAQPSAKLIYVAGNPDLYPMEYYDAKLGRYRGVIPTLLDGFSAQSGYEIVYLDDGGTDQRQGKLKNRQAELISGCTAADGFSNDVWQSGVIVLQASHNDGGSEYRILFSAIADDTVRQSLADYAAKVSEAEINGILLAETQKPAEPLPDWLIAALCIGAALLAAALAVCLYQYRKQVRRFYQMAEIDTVTGLGNLKRLKRQFPQYVHDKNRILYAAIYLTVDIDQVRRMSNAQQADAFMRCIAGILTMQMKDMDLLARVSDGAFAIVRLSSEQKETERWLEGILDEIAAYSLREGQAFISEGYAGIYQLQPGDHDLDAILLRAKQSCHYAQNNGLPFAVCTPDVLGVYQEETQLQRHAVEALENREFMVYLHFFVDAVTHEIVGAEALSRWHHPEKGMLLPGRYIPLLEQERLLKQLDYYVLEQVCAFLQNLYTQRKWDFFISCNFSRSTFASPDFVQSCIDIIDRFSFPREKLLLELTENGEARNMTFVYQNAMRMSDYGVSIALDDFGEGYTSFSDLQTYHFDGLKLDKSLIDKLHTAEGEIILQGMIDLGHRLGAVVLAEGAETIEQVQKLAALHADVIQGFYFYKPLPIREADRVLRSQA